jgi:hypothetical protein
MLDGENFRHPGCADISVVKFWDAGHNRSFSNYCCGIQLTCRDLAVFMNHSITLAFDLRSRCRGWSTAAGPITNVLFIDIKTSNPSSKLTSMVFSPNTLLKTSRTWAFHCKKSNHTLRKVCTPTKSAILHCYCWTHVIDWSIDYPRWADNVAIRSLSQETLAGAIFNRGWGGGMKDAILSYRRSYISPRDSATYTSSPCKSGDKNSPLYSLVVTGSSGLRWGG